MGLALLVAAAGSAGELLREEIHHELRHRSYMLVEHEDGATLYLFDKTISDEQAVTDKQDDIIAAALAKTRSLDGGIRARGLAELAGIDFFEALSVALALLGDPNLAVRDEAKYLILDHPSGAALAAALGLVDDELGE
jgi:hypothetical protein